MEELEALLSEAEDHAVHRCASPSPGSPAKSNNQPAVALQRKTHSRSWKSFYRRSTKGMQAARRPAQFPPDSRLGWNNVQATQCR